MEKEFLNVFVADVTPLEDENIYNYFFSLMSDERKEKILRYKRKKDRLLSLGAGILLRHSLITAGYGADNLTFSTFENGKPLIIEYPDFKYNLSHSGNMVMCVSSDREVGCDIEKTVNPRYGIINRFFSESEREYLSSLPPHEKENEFFRLWTLKESFIKLSGKGFKTSLDSFSLDLSSSPVSISSGMSDDVIFHEFDTIPLYKCSMCTEKSETAPIFKITDIGELLLLSKQH